MAIADPRLQQTEAPTQETGTLPRVPEQDRSPAALAVERLAPGRYLVLDAGDDDPVVFPLTGDVMHIGRSPAAHIVLDDASVSRRHAVLTRRGEETVILDDRSLNGVYVNGERVSEAALSDQDVVACGRVRLRYIAR